jgi:kinesin family protein C2/C3
MDHLVDRYRDMAEEKRKLHNLVLELKGNIRVFVRVRPLSDKEKGDEKGDATLTYAEDLKVSVLDEKTSKRKWFDFDRVFVPKTTQQEVFAEVVPLATSVLDGFNVCIFAYGQTGSGKTFSMSGTDKNPGLNLRVLQELFRIRTERELDFDTTISLMVTEIYNETIRDLFVTKQKKLEVKENPDKSHSVPGITEMQVSSAEEVLKAMGQTQANRTTLQTEMNEESSRSHSIVQVLAKTVSRKDKKELHGRINLVDLAGSEDVSKSGVTGEGLKEAQNINKSLSALGDVIQALQAKSQHIPYRNSMLTMMLKDSLGGDSKTLMIVQCSPARGSVTETLSSLNFGSRARNVELGQAKRNTKQS